MLSCKINIIMIAQIIPNHNKYPAGSRKAGKSVDYPVEFALHNLPHEIME
jgi:hypothetical protein